MTFPKISIRPTSWDDRDALVAMTAATGFFTDEEVRVAGEVLDDTLSGSDPDYYATTAVVRDEPVGYIVIGKVPLTDATYDVYWIVVDPEAQRGGVGRELLASAEEEIRKRGGRWILIETAGKAQYVPTHRFYLKCGYVEVSKIDDFYAPGDPRLVFGKRLDEGGR
jgi:ribosomal protein S18 acetylase RimI-like enzyme